MHTSYSGTCLMDTPEMQSSTLWSRSNVSRTKRAFQNDVHWKTCLHQGELGYRNYYQWAAVRSSQLAVYPKECPCPHSRNDLQQTTCLLKRDILATIYNTVFFTYHAQLPTEHTTMSDCSRPSCQCSCVCLPWPSEVHYLTVRIFMFNLYQLHDCVSGLRGLQESNFLYNISHGLELQYMTKK